MNYFVKDGLKIYLFIYLIKGRPYCDQIAAATLEEAKEEFKRDMELAKAPVNYNEVWVENVVDFDLLVASKREPNIAFFEI